MAGLKPTVSFEATYNPEVANLEAETATAGTISVPFAPRIAQQEQSFVGINEATQEVFVNGQRFNIDDHQSALEAEQYLDKPREVLPEGYRPVGPDEYKDYIMRIKDPTTGRLMKKNFGIGVDVSQMLGGSAMKFFGAEETGQAVIDQQQEDLRFNEPYQRAATDIDSVGDAGDWFVANAAQMAPLMAEMIVTSVLTGGAAGVAAGATATGAKLLARGATKKLATNAAAGLEQLQAGILVKGSAEHLALRNAGRAFGAKAGAIAASEGVAIGDIYQQVEESGNYDSPGIARLMTGLFSIPYAAAEVLPAFAAINLARKSGGAGYLKQGNLAQRGFKGAVAGGALEGSTEVVQDMLAMGAAGTLDLNDPEVRNQLINAFAAGAGVGSPLGSIGSMMGRTPDAAKEEAKPTVDTELENADLLNPGGQSDMFAGREDLGGAPLETDEFDRPVAFDNTGADAIPQTGRTTESLVGQEADLLNDQYDATIQRNISAEGRVTPEQHAETRSRLDAIRYQDGQGEVGTTQDPNQTTLDLTGESEGVLRENAPYVGSEMPSAAPAPAAPRYPNYNQPAAPEQGTFYPEDNVLQQDLAAQAPAPTNTAMADALRGPMEQQAAEQAAAQAQQQAAQQQAAQANAAQEAQFQQAEEAAFMQQEAALAAEQRQAPAMGDPVIMRPHVIADGPQKGQTVMYPVDVREAIEDAQSRITALEELKACRAGK